ncbi:MAG: Asp-tRNA(Asn)/Glu-tRNA(Gln) amidotransferase subunit GatA [Campylobacter sp.]|nr:Asp-tRNA(Asn)/Glu-tRNA(Gln) amidotransferase subunit GatA [Campylobacter sp.]
MITLKEALKLSKDEIKELKTELKREILAKKNLGAYIEQLTNLDISECENDGVPVAIKDNIQVKGWSVTSASKILQGYIAPYNATVIERMLGSGICPFGRTNMDEFAMGNATDTSFYGKTLNPLDPSRVPGGSSGGSAAAVGGGIAIAALGSDTGGSIRQPAAFCGCVGFKPTYGRVSRYGLGAFSSSLDQIGPITQNVEDAAILYDIISGNDPKDSTSYSGEYNPIAPNLNSDRKLTIAVIKSYIDEASEETKKALNLAIDALKAQGHNIIYKELSNSKYDIAAYYIIATAEASTNLNRYDGVRYGFRAKSEHLNELYTTTRAQGFGDEVKRRMILGTFVLSSGYYDAYYVKAQKARSFIKAEYEAVLSEADLIFMPVAPGVAFKFNAHKSPLEAYLSDIYTIGVNLAGLPAISVPVAKNKDGLNISAQLIGKAYDEQSVLDGGLIVENIMKG